MNRRKHKDVDMSAEAIDRRLREVSQLHQLGIMLKSAKKVGKVKDMKAKQQKKE